MPSLRLEPHVYEAARQFFEEHPVFEMEQLREINAEGSPLVRVLEGRCMKCGFALRPDGNPMLQGDNAVWVADTLQAVRMTHAWDQASRSAYCGGRIVFVTAPFEGLAELAD